MPRPTDRYPFERRVAAWAAAFARSMTGTELPFFIGFRPDGTVRRIYVSPPGQGMDADRKTTLASAYSAWFLYAPYDDGPEVYLEWLGLDRERVEGWLDGPVDDGALRPTDGEGSLDGWPRSWRVIVG